MKITLGAAETLALAILVSYLGIFLTKKIAILEKYKIPTPVVGGIIFSALASILFWTRKIELSTDNNLRDFLMLAFFSTIGLSAKLRMLKRGGKPLLILMFLATIFLFIQNSVGVFLAWLTGLHPAIGLLGGSVTLVGGHGTGLAWAGKFYSQFDLDLVYEITIACATAGLVLGGIIGGPIGAYLINKFNLKAGKDKSLKARKLDKYIHTESVVDLDGMLESIAMIAVCIVLGTMIYNYVEINYPDNRLLSSLPKFVSCLFVGIMITNIFDFTKIHKTNQKSLDICAELSLGIFLSISMMSLKLWILIDLAGPLLIILGVQTFIVIIYNIFVVHRFSGNNYSSSIISAGFSGLSMGATPTAIANMSALTQRFGHSAEAFLIVPLVGAFFIDIANTIVINLFFNLPIYS